MTETHKLTVGQAAIRFLAAQQVERYGVRAPVRRARGLR
jgi:TPP-dependent trihydroxycyclohexane-1,2-dione (THcHDO) dehydratase